MKDLYYILGTHIKGTPAEIGDAYRSLAKKLGPEAINDDPFLHRHFTEITDAYEILSDPKKRLLYDQAFKNAQRKQLAGFKISNLNIAATGIFLLFTGLFAYYVIRLVSTKKLNSTAQPIVATPAKVYKHHKHKHQTKAAQIAQTKTVVAKKDSIISVAAKLPTVSKPIVTNNTQPVVQVQIPSSPIDSGYVTNLKANLAGLVYLHQTDDYMSPVITVLPHQSKIRVLEKGLNFYKVAFNEHVGYIPKWTITRQ